MSDKIVIPHLEYLNRAKLVVGNLRNATSTEVQVAEDEGPEGVLTSVPYDYLIIATGSAPQSAIPFQDRINFYRKRESAFYRNETVVLERGWVVVGVEGGGGIGVYACVCKMCI